MQLPYCFQYWSPESMRSVLALSALATLVACPTFRSVESYIASEGPIAKANLLANIGDGGARAPGAFPGVVVASPSTRDPNYYYTWIRDSSLVFKLITDLYTHGEDDSLGNLVNAFAESQARIQQVANPSGTVATGGLGEPKFYVNETQFEDSWGRPQRDGPALRATTLITYANHLLDRGDSERVNQTLWPAIKLDLDYIVQNWNQTGFDLWEEVRGASFFTTAAQHRSLREGAALAQALGHDASAYLTQASNVLCFLQTYWNGQYIVANVGHRSGVDSNTVLASIHTFDPKAGCDATTFQPCSDKALANLLIYVDSFRSVYPINSGISQNQAVAVGRYKEDVYYDGNPWYLSGFAVAEQLYNAMYVWSAQGSLTVTDISKPFFSVFSAGIITGTYRADSDTYLKLVKAISQYADGFIAINAKYTPTDGSLAEQFDKVTGSPRSALHLTWSYASALTAFYARNASLVPASWGAKGLQSPEVCLPGPQPPTSTVVFKEVATTVFGENIYLIGSVEELKNWNPDNAIALSAAGYPTWKATVTITADTRVEYKYVRKWQNGGVQWESDPNRVVTTPGEGEIFTVNDSWR